MCREMDREVKSWAASFTFDFVETLDTFSSAVSTLFGLGMGQSSLGARTSHASVTAVCS